MTPVTEHSAPLGRAVAHLVSQARFPLAFGGEVGAEGGARLEAYAGIRGRSIRNLLIESGEGLGGRALLELRPRFTTDYARTGWITDRYSRAVGAEGIVSLLAVPIVVDGALRGLLYAGFRDAVEIGDSAARRAAEVARRVAWEYSVQDEVERRLALLRAAEHASALGREVGVDRESIRERFAELRELASGVDDPALRRRLEVIADGLTGRAPAPQAAVASSGPAPGEPPVRLTPRERDVLALVALGLGNAAIGRRLGLTESTVKKYLATAAATLGAHNRFDAVLRARLAGLLP